MELHGHVLVWFDDIPDWLKAAPTADIEAIMNEHIDKVGSLRGQDQGLGRRERGRERRQHRFVRTTSGPRPWGTDYIRKGLCSSAHTADPTAVLRYNEYDIERTRKSSRASRPCFRSLKDQGVPVHALGWQLHVKPSSFDRATLLARMNEIADLGFDNYITELDVELPATPARPTSSSRRDLQDDRRDLPWPRRHKTIVVWGLRRRSLLAH